MSENEEVIELPRYAHTARNVHIDLRGRLGKVIVDGIDLSLCVSGIAVDYHVYKGLPVVHLSIPALVLTIDGAADVLAGFVDTEELERLKEFAQ